jgi:hypothetical protein
MDQILQKEFHINHQENHKKILLCKRKQAMSGNTMGYVFYWRRCFKETEGAKPMNIKWELSRQCLTIYGKNLLKCP